MEMHTVHLAQEGTRRLAEETLGEEEGFSIWASAMGLMFDVDDYDPSITVEEKKIID